MHAPWRWPAMHLDTCRHVLNGLCSAPTRLPAPCSQRTGAMVLDASGGLQDTFTPLNHLLLAISAELMQRGGAHDAAYA